MWGDAVMFDKVSHLVNEIYDGSTNKFLGYSRFDLSQSEEEKLLDLVNYGKVPESLILLNVRFSQTPADYVPPSLTQKSKRRGILRGLFRDADSGKYIPVEIYFTFDVRGRGNLSGDIYYFDSLEYSNIQIDHIDVKTS